MVQVMTPDSRQDAAGGAKGPTPTAPSDMPQAASSDTPIRWAEDNSVPGETPAERARRRDGQYRAAEIARDRQAHGRRSTAIFLSVVAAIALVVGSAVGVHEHREHEAQARAGNCLSAHYLSDLQGESDLQFDIEHPECAGQF